MRGIAAKGMEHCSLLRVIAGGAACVLFGTGLGVGQVFTVSPEKVDGHYLEFHPTNVALPDGRLSERGRQELIRSLTAEQGFAMRPLPLASRGLTLHANGELQPNGSAYVTELSEHGTSAKPGERCVITELKIKEDRIVFELNGGPDPKHKWLRHVSLGTSTASAMPVSQSDPQEPTGSRVTLVFPHAIPEVDASQVEALLAPVLGFGVKSPTESYVDTLPPVLKKAILEHHVLVGMSLEMVQHAMGQPLQKIREREGQMPFEEWIYGEAPQPVQFVRINGNRVIRVEVAEVGKPLVIRAENEMGDYWNTAPNPNIHTIRMGDEDQAAIARQSAPQAPPSLRAPGEKLPTDNQKDHPTMQPVQFPKGTETGSAPASQTAPATPQPSTAPQPAATPQQLVAAQPAP